MKLLGVKAALNSNGRFKYKKPEGVVDHLVVGGGVVGLAIARILTKLYPEKSTYLVERNNSVGEETSSRNSEVIHAGLYYPTNSLKEALCLRGRRLLYEYCETSSVPYRKTGKLVVAHKHQQDYVKMLHKKAIELEWPAPLLSKADSPSSQALPIKLLSGDEARQLEPDLSLDIATALLSPETGVIDSHSYMESLHRDVVESENGDLVCSTAVVRVDPYERSKQMEGSPDIDAKEDGWVVQMVTRGTNGVTNGEGDAFFVRTLINTSGLSGNLILNALLPMEKRIAMYYARGSYAAYRGPGVSNVSRLIYPCPGTSKGSEHSFQSLGTHLTLDLAGNIKFGPNIQWISPSGHSSQSLGGPATARGETQEFTANEYSFSEDDTDFWKQHLVPDESQLAAMYEAVKSYLPGVDASKFRPDYVGIRPKLVPPWGGFQDFVFRKDYSGACIGNDNRGNHRRHGAMITLLGIESPGLTASLAIAEKVASMLE